MSRELLNAKSVRSGDSARTGPQQNHRNIVSTPTLFLGLLFYIHSLCASGAVEFLSPYKYTRSHPAAGIPPS